jgi:hypothetical protein
LAVLAVVLVEWRAAQQHQVQVLVVALLPWLEVLTLVVAVVVLLLTELLEARVS